MRGNKTPDIEEVKAYARANGFISNPYEFYEKYNANGWTQNGEEVQNWRRLFDGWERTERKHQRPNIQPAYKTQTHEAVELTPEQRKAIEDDIHAKQRIIATTNTVAEMLEAYERYKHERKQHGIADW